MTIYFCHYFLFLLPYYNSQFHLLLCDLYIVAFWKGSTAKVCSFPASRRWRCGDVLPVRWFSAHPTMFYPSDDALPIRWCSAHPMMLFPSVDALPIPTVVPAEPWLRHPPGMQATSWVPWRATTSGILAQHHQRASLKGWILSKWHFINAIDWGRSNSSV